MQPCQSICKKLILLALIIFIPLFLPGHVAIAAENDEVAFLLSYIAESDCIFLRNGDKHLAEEASEHLKRKYQHAKGRINSAQDFIDQIASKSSFSGKHYEVLCNNIKSPTKDWLTEALAEHRFQK